jgi:hypothetical protein
MIYPNIAPEVKARIKSIVVKEFGVAQLSDDPEELLR